MGCRFWSRDQRLGGSPASSINLGILEIVGRDTTLVQAADDDLDFRSSGLLILG